MGNNGYHGQRQGCLECFSLLGAIPKEFQQQKHHDTAARNQTGHKEARRLVSRLGDENIVSIGGIFGGVLGSQQSLLLVDGKQNGEN